MESDESDTGQNAKENDPEVESQLSFLKTVRRLRLNDLHEEKRDRIGRVLRHLHNKEQLSVLQISRMIGRSQSFTWNLYRRLGIKTRTPAEADRLSAMARSKHKRIPFSGTDLDRAYMMGYASGDLTSRQVSGTAIFVTSTTTHPAFAELFESVFRKYGPMYKYPMFDNIRGHRWRLAVRLDNSFRFLLLNPLDSMKSVSGRRELLMHWFGALVDSDGSITVSDSNGYARLRLAIFSNRVELLTSIKKRFLKEGFHFDGPYLTNRKESTTAAFGIRYTKDMWNVALQRTGEVKKLLFELPLRHKEKIEKKRICLSVSPAEKFVNVKAGLELLRRKISAQVKRFVVEAEREYIERHPNKKEMGRKVTSSPSQDVSPHLTS